jgi:hypothetical protein
VIDQQGRIVQRHVGQLNMARTEAEVRVLLGEPVDTGVERQ